MSAISLHFCKKLGPVSQQRRGVALVSNGPAMALPFTCTSCPKDELGANEPGGVTASTQPYHPLHQPLNTALLRLPGVLQTWSREKLPELIGFSAPEGDGGPERGRASSKGTQLLRTLPPASHRGCGTFRRSQGPATSLHAYLQRKGLKPEGPRKITQPQCFHP